MAHILLFPVPSSSNSLDTITMLRDSTIIDWEVAIRGYVSVMKSKKEVTCEIVKLLDDYVRELLVEAFTFGFLKTFEYQ